MRKMYTIMLAFGLTLSSIAGEPEFKVRKTHPKNNMKEDGGEKCFNENTHIINLGVGLNGPSYHRIYHIPGEDYGRTPAMSLTYEQAWPKKLGPGFLGIGAYFGYQHERYSYHYDDFWYNNKYHYRHTWNHFMIAARGAYHWDVLNAKNAEVYAGIVAGLRIQTHTYETNDPDRNDPYSYSSGSVYPTYSVFAGARWYFVKSVGLFAEVGYGISYLTGGFSFKF